MVHERTGPFGGSHDPRSVSVADSDGPLTPAGFTFLLNTLAFIGHTEFLDSTAMIDSGWKRERSIVTSE